MPHPKPHPHPKAFTIAVTMGVLAVCGSAFGGRGSLGGFVVALALNPFAWLACWFSILHARGLERDDGGKGPTVVVVPKTVSLQRPDVRRGLTLSEKLEALERLGKLREQNILTEEEFAAEKAEILDAPT